MDKHYEVKYHRQEKTNWWFAARRHIILNLLGSDDKNAKILDIGCSGGILIDALKTGGFKSLSGIDISADAIDLCKRRGLQDVFVMDGINLQFSDNQFDIIIASDILEHIDVEDVALSEWNRILKPDGKLIVFVPAFSFLWCKHDEINHHYRRYSKLQLIRVLEKAQFQMDRASYWNFGLFFPTALIRLGQSLMRKSKNGQGDHLIELNSVANSLLFYMVKSENQFLSVLNFPLGVSVFAIAKKRVTKIPSVASSIV